MEIKAHILLMIPDEDTAGVIRVLLNGDGYAVTRAENTAAGLARISAETDMVILGTELWDRSGLLVCEDIRKVSNVLVLFLSYRDGESDVMLGLLAGADDYMVMPFSNAELLGRVRALLRRYLVYKGKPAAYPALQETYIKRSVIKISKEYNDVSIDGKTVDLPDIEYRILRLLMQYPNKIFSAQNIYESVWEEPYFYSCNNTVMVHIRKLRMRIEKDPNHPAHIKTVWGRGYRFE